MAYCQRRRVFTLLSIILPHSGSSISLKTMRYTLNQGEKKISALLEDKANDRMKARDTPDVGTVMQELL